jgi:Mrp family chromosome partitioning ATPase
MESKYYGAIKRVEREQIDGGRPAWEQESVIREDPSPGTTTLVPLPVLHQMPATIARDEAIRRLSERLAPLAVVENSVRLVVGGCRPKDGASTVATAMAIDLSQRLALATVLVDAHLRHPSLHRFFVRPDRKPPELILNGSLQIRPTGWPRLDLASCSLTPGDTSRKRLLDEFENLLGGYQAAVIDIGVSRLDARMLPLARPTDPILLVVRYGHTERQELATTAAALRAANRAVAGVILNAATGQVAKPFGKLMSQ